MNGFAVVVLGVSMLSFAQNSSDFIVGHLIKIAANANSLAPGRENYNGSYLFKIRTSDNKESIALYHPRGGQQGQEYAESFKENSDVLYKISGKNLLLKNPDGHELKLLLCTTKDKAIVCGDDIFPKMD